MGRGPQKQFDPDKVLDQAVMVFWAKGFEAAAAAVATDVELVINNAGVLQTSFTLDQDAASLLQSELEVNVAKNAGSV